MNTDPFLPFYSYVCLKPSLKRLSCLHKQLSHSTRQGRAFDIIGPFVPDANLYGCCTGVTGEPSGNGMSKAALPGGAGGHILWALGLHDLGLPILWGLGLASNPVSLYALVRDLVPLHPGHGLGGAGESPAFPLRRPNFPQFVAFIPRLVRSGAVLFLASFLLLRRP